MNLSPHQIKKLNELLIITPPNSTISPDYLSFKSDMQPEIINQFLTALSNRSLIKHLFVLRCSNEDEDMVHKFTFNNNKDMADFIQRNEYSCPECDYKLITKDIRVFFQTQDYARIQNGEQYD